MFTWWNNDKNECILVLESICKLIKMQPLNSVAASLLCGGPACLISTLCTPLYDVVLLLDRVVETGITMCTQCCAREYHQLRRIALEYLIGCCCCWLMPWILQCILLLHVRYACCALLSMIYASRWPNGMFLYFTQGSLFLRFSASKKLLMLKRLSKLLLDVVNMSKNNPLALDILLNTARLFNNASKPRLLLVSDS